jgi:PAS domain S-box-containing protein
METIELTTKQVIEVETSARTFALTGQELLLAHYETMRGTVTHDQATLRYLTSDNPNEQRLLDVLEPQARAALNLAESMVVKRQQTHISPGAAEILETERLIGAVYATTQEMHAEEMRLLSQRMPKTEAGRRLTSLIIVVGILVGAGLLALARLAINREIDVSARARAQIGILNAGLEERVEQRTAALESEIIERKRAEETLREQAQVLDLAQVFVRDMESRVVFWPRGAEKLYGFNIREALGALSHDLFHTQFPEPLETIEKKLLETGVWEGELIHRKRDGDTIVVSSAWVLHNDNQGRPARVLETDTDITQRKAAEREIQKLNDELEHRVARRTAQLETANKELEAFSYSVSHDLRAPLRHIGGFSKMLVEEFGSTLDPTAQRYLERIQTGTQKMALLVDELLNLARVGRHVLRLQSAELNSIVAEVITMLEPETEGRQVQWIVADLPAVDCDPVLVKQIFQNLLVNALKFSRRRTRAVIEVSCAEREETGQTVFMVRDNGVGFNMKYVDKLFGVFERLHGSDEFEGTGIGLVTVQRIVHKHGGRVWAEGEADKGAAFYFTLGAEKQAEKSESRSNGATAGGQS